MKFIKLTLENTGNETFVNAEKITDFQINSKGTATTVAFGKDEYFFVKETPEEILEQIKSLDVELIEGELKEFSYELNYLQSPKSENDFIEKMNVRDFCLNTDASVRLKNILSFNFPNELIKDIDLKKLKRCRNLGKLTYKEFLSYRNEK